MSMSMVRRRITINMVSRVALPYGRPQGALFLGRNVPFDFASLRSCALSDPFLALEVYQPFGSHEAYVGLSGPFGI